MLLGAKKKPSQERPLLHLQLYSYLAYELSSDSCFSYFWLFQLQFNTQFQFSPLKSKMFPFGLTSVTLMLASYWVDDHIKCEGCSCSISETENGDIISLRIRTYF